MKRTLLLCTTALSIVWGAEPQEGEQAESGSGSPKMHREDAFCLEPSSTSVGSPTKAESGITIYTKQVQEQLTALAEILGKASEATKKAEYALAMSLYRTLSAELKTLYETHSELSSDTEIIDLRTHALYGLINSLWKLDETSELLPLLDEVVALKQSETDTEPFKRMKLNAHISSIKAAMEEKDQAGYEKAAALQDSLLDSLDAVLSIEVEPSAATKDACTNTLHLLCVANYYLGKHEDTSIVLDRMKSISESADRESLVALIEHFNKEDKWVHVAKAGEELEKRGLSANTPEDVIKVLDSAKEKVAFLESAKESLSTYMAATRKALNPDYPAATEALEGWLTTVDQLAEKGMLTREINNISQYAQQAMTLVQVCVKMGNSTKAIQTLNRIEKQWEAWWNTLSEKEENLQNLYSKELCKLSSLYLQLSAPDEMEKVLSKAAEVNPSVKDGLDYATMDLDMQILRMNKLIKEESYEEVSFLAEGTIESIDSLFKRFPELKGKLLPLCTKELEKTKASCTKANKETVVEKIDAKILEWSAPEVEEEKKPTVDVASKDEILEENATESTTKNDEVTAAE